MKLDVPMTCITRRELAPMRSILQKCPYSAHAPTFRPAWREPEARAVGRWRALRTGLGVKMVPQKKRKIAIPPVAALSVPLHQPVCPPETHPPGNNPIRMNPRRPADKPVPGLEPDEYYLDEYGRVVFTAEHHRRRGYCCKSGCRHCPYGFVADVRRQHGFDEFKPH